MGGGHVRLLIKDSRSLAGISGEGRPVQWGYQSLEFAAPEIKLIESASKIADGYGPGVMNLRCPVKNS
jgi:hypothetical protein